MRRYSRMLAMSLTVVAAAAMIWGCSGKMAAPEAQANQEGTKEGANEAAKTDEEQITLRFLSYAKSYEEIEQQIVDEYHKQNPNVTVEIEYLTNLDSKEYLAKTDVMVMGGEKIDILMTPSPTHFTIRAESDSYLPLDSFFEAENSKPEDEFNVIYRVKDQVYGIPAEMKYGVVMLNKDMLDEAGLPVPPVNWTWDDYRDYAIKLTKGEGANKIYGSYLHKNNEQVMYGITSAQKGNKYFNEDGSLTFANPEFAEFLQYRYDLENTDQASVPLADVKALNLNYYEQFFNGKVAMMPMLTHVINYIGDQNYPHDFVTAVAPLPLWDKNGEHFNPVGATIYSIAKTSEHPQEAFDFLKFWCTEGVMMKGKTIANIKGTSRLESAERMVRGFKELIDMDSFSAYFNDEKWVDSYEDFVPPYQGEIESALLEETDKYLLNTQSLEDTVKNLMERGNAIIKENQ